MKLSQLLAPDECLTPLPYDPDILFITCRIEEIAPGCLFICTKGKKADSHLMLPYILSHGASAVLVEQDLPVPEGENRVLRVSSTRRAMAYAFSAFSHHPTRSLTVFGITGTNGKTSTACFLEACLRQGGYRTALVGTLGCYIDGVPYTAPTEEENKRLTTMTTPDPDTLYPLMREMVKRGVTHVVMEVSSHALALEKVSPILFDFAVFTNLSPEHLDFHADMDAYRRAKEKLFVSCRHAVLNTDDPFGLELSTRLSCPVTTCGVVHEADATATQMTPADGDGLSYFYRYGEKTNILTVHTPGLYQMSNSLLAVMAAHLAGVSVADAQKALDRVRGIPGRLEKVSLPEDEVRVYIDYAHTEEALKNLLLTARKFVRGEEKILLVFGCGGDRDRTKRAPMGRCAMRYADRTVITTDNPRTESPMAIINDILEGYSSAEGRTVITDRTKAIGFAIANANAGDVVLVAGKGHEGYEVRGREILPFDERKIIKEGLNARKATQTIGKR